MLLLAAVKESFFDIASKGRLTWGEKPGQLVKIDQNPRKPIEKVRTYTIVHESSTPGGKGSITNGHEGTRIGTGTGI
jgi:hypothetical protein